MGSRGRVCCGAACLCDREAGGIGWGLSWVLSVDGAVQEMASAASLRRWVAAAGSAGGAGGVGQICLRQDSACQKWCWYYRVTLR